MQLDLFGGTGGNGGTGGYQGGNGGNAEGPQLRMQNNGVQNITVYVHTVSHIKQTDTTRTETTVVQRDLILTQRLQSLDDRKLYYPGPLKWTESIVDLLKLVGEDSDSDARRTLAVELGLYAKQSASMYIGSKEQNIVLYRAFIRQLAEDPHWQSKLSTC
ncbi:hypothetical protein R3P38DRAFT_2981072 [Favolaschia claudopus]|uniref:DUF3597 domain-containing protein n=1 Tax=Favolaschia claudopus TaxID=2862362 RepID=A0AAW0B1P6_9AGAR